METGILDSNWSAHVVQRLLETEDERLMFIRFNGLSGKLVKDGNQWCAITENDLHDGIAGFGDSPIHAVYQWHQEYYKPLKQD